MRSRFTPLLLVALLMPTRANPQRVGSEAKADQNATKFVGVWRGQFDSLPGVDLVISDENSELHGAILFYFHVRRDLNSPYTSTAGLPEPVFNLSAQGQTLRFQVSHRRAHPPQTLQDAPKNFHLKLIGPDRAELMNESESAPVVQMKRTDY
jgi:hypothetical protein